jgi:retron-type reverse transcriptase
MKIYTKVFTRTVAVSSLFTAWEEFCLGKKNKADVLRFGHSLEENIFALHDDLRQQIYRHGPYHGFYISDPKVRHIHKATVRDRIVHHAVFRVLYHIFEPTFIANSFSCRINKGTHKGVERVQHMVRLVSRNGTAACYALKCDVKKFFDSVDHDILLHIIGKRVKDASLMWLLTEIIESYTASDSREREYFREGRLESPSAT